jgi:uncharacterized protein (TIGR02271 family)
MRTRAREEGPAVLTDREVSAAIGSAAYDTAGDKIGTVGHFFVDDRTGAPTWVAVTTGLLGTRHSVVPAADAVFADGALRLPVQKHAVRTAPEVPDSARLDPTVEAELRRHYGISTPDGDGVPSEPPGPVPVSDAEVAAARASGVPADGAMVRSEERLRVGTERVPSARVRLVKYVVTEEVQVTVPIRREEVRLEEIPLGDEPAGTSGAGESLLPPGTEPVGGLPDEVVLHAERPVVSVEVVPVEHVRVRTEVVTGQEQISDRLQRERIVADES